MDCFQARPFSPLAHTHGALRLLTEAELQEIIFFFKRAVGRAAPVRGKGTQWAVLAVWRKMRSTSSLWTFLTWTGAINHMALYSLRARLCSLPLETDGAISAHQQQSFQGPGAPADVRCGYFSGRGYFMLCLWYVSAFEWNNPSSGQEIPTRKMEKECTTV